MSLVSPGSSQVTATFEGEVIYWRGPSPFYFVALPDDVAAEIAEISARVSYGWGCIPVTCLTGDTTWTTSLFPREGGYLLPVKVTVRRAEKIALGDTVTVTMQVA